MLKKSGHAARQSLPSFAELASDIGCNDLLDSAVSNADTAYRGCREAEEGACRHNCPVDRGRVDFPAYAAGLWPHPSCRKDPEHHAEFIVRARGCADVVGRQRLLLVPSLLGPGQLQRLRRRSLRLLRTELRRLRTQRLSEWRLSGWLQSRGLQSGRLQPGRLRLRLPPGMHLLPRARLCG